MTETESLLEQLFPVWDKLTREQQQSLINSVNQRHILKGSVLQRGDSDCIGLFIVKSGQIRVFMPSDSGKEITLYRLFERDMCLFSASCIMHDIQFDVYFEAEKDTDILVIPSDVYKKLTDSSLPAANYMNQLIASRFSEVMALVDQIVFKRFDSRLAAFLNEQINIEESTELHITHEKIANNLGTAREVVTKMLNYFQNEGILTIKRGSIEIKDENKLRELIQE